MALLFAGAVIITALALALSAYFITKSAQENDALDKALAQSRFNLFLADTLLPPSPEPTDYTKVLDALAIRGDFATLIQTPNDIYVSGPQVDRALISWDLARVVAEGQLGYQRVRTANQPVIVVGGRQRSDLTLYFFYPQGEQLAQLARLRTVLLTGGGILAVVGAFVGVYLARRLMKPIHQASAAADRMSRGDLSIRLQEGDDEFGFLAASFNRMAENLRAQMDELEAKRARERQFVADVAHELRTPVSALLGEVSLLRKRLEELQPTAIALSPEVIQLARLVGSDIRRLSQLVDDLLEISRLDAGAADTVFEQVDLAIFFRQLLQVHGWADVVEVKEMGGQAGTAVCYELHTDKRRVERIMVNLLQNALSHGSPPVTIEMRWRPALSGDTAEAEVQTMIEVAVSDSGPGLPAAHIDRVFDRFYKADPSRSASRGSGLGLAIARENARLLGGDLRASNLPGGGARFVLTLPIREGCA